jgi:hypothetical protein
MRTIAEIYNELAAEKDSMQSLQDLTTPGGINNAQTLLSELNSPSKVAVWRLWLWVFAYGIFVFEGIMDAFKKDVDASVAKRINYGHPIFWQNETLKYQHGYNLIFVGDNYSYAVQDEAALIVKHCASEVQIEDGLKVIYIKAVKSVNDELEPLNFNEKAGLFAYLEKIGPAGSYIKLVSDPADELKINITAYYNPLLINNQGKLHRDNGVEPLKVALKDYLNVKNIRFNGELDLVRLVDALQKAEGIVAPVINSIEARPFGQPSFVAIGNFYVAKAGYLKIEDVNLAITYLPKNV